MNSLMNYGSDDDYEDSNEEKSQTDWRDGNKRETKTTTSKQTDANYEEVQMDLSEESNESRNGQKEIVNQSKKSNRREETRHSNTSRDRDDYYNNKRKDERYYSGSTSTSTSRRSCDDRNKYSRSDRRERSTKSKRSSSRERYSRSSSNRTDGKYTSRSRSRSRERSKYTKRYDRASNKMAQLDKMGIEIKTPDCQYIKPLDLQKSMDDEKRNNMRNDNNNQTSKDFIPGITGRFREQIERRKLLWQKKEPEQQQQAFVQQQQQQQQKQQQRQAHSIGGTTTSRNATKVWESTIFAQDTDGKVASKFKRLMGIKGNADNMKSATDDGLKKQEEMFSSMEQQYEVARTTTHTMRGVGLGFGSFQR